MPESPAVIFQKNETVETFASAVEKSGGDFPFEAEDMIALGQLYFERYPDSTHGRNMEEVHLGYSLTRICIVEKAIYSLPEERKDIYRCILHGKKSPFDEIPELASVYGRKVIESDYKSVSSALDKTKAGIDLIPKGMIKERFVGGISNLYNILYILKMSLDKIESSP